MKLKRINTRSIILFFLVIIGIFAATFGRSLMFPAPNDPAYSKVVSEYDTSKLAKGFGKSNDFSGAYAVGANSKGMPIFKDNEKALEQAKIDYADGFKAIQKKQGILPINKLTWSSYYIYGWQIPTNNKNLSSQGGRITQFFGIYKNSFPRDYLSKLNLS